MKLCGTLPPSEHQRPGSVGLSSGTNIRETISQHHSKDMHPRFDREGRTAAFTKHVSS